MLNISLSGVIWTAVNLLVLYVLLKKFLFRPVTAMIESRQKEIEDNVAAAEDQRARAEADREAYAAKLSQAAGEADGLVREAKTRGEREYQSILAAAQTDARQLTDQAQAQIAADRAVMLSGARKEVAALALLTAAKVVGREMSGDDDRALVDQFLSEAGESS